MTNTSQKKYKFKIIIKVVLYGKLSHTRCSHSHQWLTFLCHRWTCSKWSMQSEWSETTVIWSRNSRKHNHNSQRLKMNRINFCKFMRSCTSKPNSANRTCTCLKGANTKMSVRYRVKSRNKEVKIKICNCRLGRSILRELKQWRDCDFCSRKENIHILTSKRGRLMCTRSWTSSSRLKLKENTQRPKWIGL